MPKKIKSDNDDDIKTIAIERTKFTSKLVQSAYEKWELSDFEREVLAACLGKAGARTEVMQAGDLRLRLEASRALDGILQKRWNNQPSLKFWMVTALDDIGNASDRAPDIRLGELIGRLGAAIRAWGMSGIVIGEAHPFSNYPGEGRGRTISTQPNAILWSTEPVDVKKLQDIANDSRAWRGALGARGIDIKALPTPDDLQRVVYYLFKPWHSAKNVMPHKKKIGRVRLMDTRQGYRPELALRVFEGLSQIEFMSLLLGVNEGAAIRQALRTELTQWHRSRQCPVLVPRSQDLWQFWADVRTRNGSKKYLPFRYDNVVAKVKPASSVANRPSNRRTVRAMPRYKSTLPPQALRRRGPKPGAGRPPARRKPPSPK